MENFRVILLLSFFSLSALSKKKFPFFITLFFAPPSLLSFPNFTQKIFFFSLFLPYDRRSRRGGKRKRILHFYSPWVRRGGRAKNAFLKGKAILTLFSFLILECRRERRPQRRRRISPPPSPSPESPQAVREAALHKASSSLSLLFWSQGRDFDYFPLFSATTTAGEERRRGKIMRPR